MYEAPIQTSRSLEEEQADIITINTPSRISRFTTVDGSFDDDVVKEPINPFTSEGLDVAHRATEEWAADLVAYKTLLETKGTWTTEQQQSYEAILHHISTAKALVDELRTLIDHEDDVLVEERAEVLGTLFTLIQESLDTFLVESEEEVIDIEQVVDQDGESISIPGEDEIVIALEIEDDAPDQETDTSPSEGDSSQFESVELYFTEVDTVKIIEYARTYQGGYQQFEQNFQKQFVDVIQGPAPSDTLFSRMFGKTPNSADAFKVFCLYPIGQFLKLSQVDEETLLEALTKEQVDPADFESWKQAVLLWQKLGLSIKPDDYFGDVARAAFINAEKLSWDEA